MIETEAKSGRPRSEEARRAVLHAVDDLLLELGYAAMTMKGIAERAGVGRQTVYRWWSTKAEILVEASAEDAEEELTVAGSGSAEDRVEAFLRAALVFLDRAPAGIAYRTLLAAAQHDEGVAELVARRDPLLEAARRVVVGIAADDAAREAAVFQLAGPPLLWILAGRPASGFDVSAASAAVLHALHGEGSR